MLRVGRRPRRTIHGLLIGMSLGFLIATATAAWAQTVEVDPPAQEPGGSVTFFGSGWQPGESITVQFGGSTIATATADDAGNWQASGIIPEAIPAGQHPMDFNGDQGSTVGLDYEVLPGEAPPPDTAAPGESPGAGAGGGGGQPGETPEGRGAPGAEAVEDDDGGVPAWVWILIIVGAFALALLGGWRMAARRGAADTGTFIDAGGRTWEYCEARACDIKRQVVTDTGGRRILVKCEPKPGMCQGSGCGCVLFIDRGGGRPERADLNEEGFYVLKPGETPSCRCIKA